jgi:hypothetical protein
MTAYLWVPGSPGRPDADAGFLAYHIEKDRWEELPLPPGDLGWLHGIVQAGERIVAYRGSDEQGEQPDFVFDPATSSWSELPPDPLSPSFDRSMAWSGRELLLFEHELVPNPGSEKPALTRAAALDLESGAWRRLPDSEIFATGPWVPDDGRLIQVLTSDPEAGSELPANAVVVLSIAYGPRLPMPTPDRSSSRRRSAACSVTTRRSSSAPTETREGFSSSSLTPESILRRGRIA